MKFDANIVKKEVKSKRPMQIAKEIRVIISDLFARGKVQDVALFDKQIMINKVEVSSDLSSAKIYVLPFAESLDKKEMLKILNKNAAFFRHQVGKALHIKVIPVLRFYIDDHLERLAAVEEMFKKIK